MRWLFHFILSHSIFIAFCAAGLSLQTLQLLFLPVNNYLLTFIFFATLCGYNAYWIVSRLSFSKKTSIVAFLQKSYSSFIVLALAIAGMVFCSMKLNLVMYNTVLTFILLGLYAVPVLPFKQLHFTRKAGFVKTVLLAFAWTVVTILIPLQIPIYAMRPAALLIFINRFLLMLLLCIIFDKRDAALDKIRGLQSLATDTRPLILHSLIALTFLIYTVVSIALHHYGVTVLQVLALVLAGLVTMIVYVASLTKRGYVFYYFLVDGLMLLSALFTAAASFL